ncbi:N-acetylglucosamine-6-phosphate deacetylase [Rhodobacter sp. KR11]|uniref:N-acetylglucosamine-6-phosphate deacetylase n=1 Tax=Rhodobacter sp. KR11 TaxID=2974588 RepID=UPI0022218552|nr:N-acetylglucosamine-6-phosphate deacetylase [Rhodobacter sp. KR11]MCW1917171.1 N-acetylglucosamine-6-phosphate deacetylase [Rhodobacter sp. KR11]
MTLLQPDLIFDGQSLRKGVLRLEGDRVLAIQDGAGERIAGILSPGFIDLQVNGGGDVLLNTSPTVAGMQAIAAAHRRFGTVGILPTVITDAPDVLDAVTDAALAARGLPGILGLHIEGPHISVPRRGTHKAAFVRPFDDRTLTAVRRLRAGGVRVMLTLAPEAATPAQVAELAALGVVISIGHSDATGAEVRGLLAAGASCFTHLFNAMSPMVNRAEGVTGACINSHAFAGIICDGVHVADEMVGLAIRARPLPDTTFLVSDAMPTVGGSDRFTLYGREIHVENGRLVNAEGSLAGAHVTMAESVKRLIDKVGLAPEAALRMATTIPARVMGLPTGIVGQSAADLVILDQDWQVRAL